MKRFIASVCLVTLFSVFSTAQVSVYPTNWWIGMKHNAIQLLIRGNDVLFNKSQLYINYPGVSVKKVTPLENGKYMAVDIVISAAAKPGAVTLQFVSGSNKQSVQWWLKERRKGNGTAFAQGVRSNDFIYLAMPDRFSNGDPSNDRIPGMRDQSLNRDSVYHRHGGDFQGIINHLDYLQSLGVTTLWMTPVIENDQPNRTEHGYSFTDHYKIDPRYGGEKMYKQLSDALHKRGMKLIQDAVYNHVGSKNIFFLDPPVKDWFHQWPVYTGTSYKDQPLFDPHASAHDKKVMSDGWFTPQMPDLNQSNPYVANFLIQHAIWSVEEFGVDGWRIDTYIYNDLAFMNRCNSALLEEYPKITMFGETWVHGTAAQAFFAQNNINTSFKSNLIGVTDFQTLFYGILPALNENFGWTDGVNKLYSTLSNDFLYKNPMNNVIFLDNHDLNRITSEVKGDTAKLKAGIGWLLTSRGIPEMYYGTEVMMKGEKNPNDGWVRLDFPGGWDADKKNAFTQKGLTAEEKNIQDYVKALGNYRKHSSAITTGKMMQYVPEDGLYVYFRYDQKQTVMCVMNTASAEKKIDFGNYTERTGGFSMAKNVVTGNMLGSSFSIPAKTMWVLELKK
ncbi:MAG: glycoside hydrolase family 13 protein [Bacteroidota bacterium]|nr:glycoside hydrolase family 13 protein [Bacteroidota bacterium]